MTHQTAPPPWGIPPAPPRRPGALTAACVLWICAGVLNTLGAIASLINPVTGYTPGAFFAIFLLLGTGVAFLVLASRLKRGAADARPPLTVVGCVAVLTIWVTPFVVAAIILQFRPSVTAWMKLVSGAHQPPQGQVTPPNFPGTA